MPKSILATQTKTEEQTESLATALHGIARAGDVILLSGDIGAGKSFLARAFIRSACGAETEVPSPTFTLVQVYEAPKFEIWHCDLYRLSSPDEVIELGLEAAFQEAVTLIEWPDRLADLQPEGALSISIGVVNEVRYFEFFGSEKWRTRLKDIDV